MPNKKSDVKKEITDAQIRNIARVAHEANAAWCLVNGNNSQTNWANAPDWQKNSAIAGVKFHIENPNADPAASHEEWFKHKEAEGWTFDIVKDEEAKTHPCMVPFDELSKKQQAKDKMFKAIVHSLL